MEVGSVWGHGSYVAPDWTADWLHREATFILDRWANAEFGTEYAKLDGEQQAQLQGRLAKVMRTNTYDPATRDRHRRTRSGPRRSKRTSSTTRDVFANGKAEYAIPAGAVTDPDRLRKLSAFFFWTSWAASTNRPDDDITYTHNWPYEPLVGNRPTGETVVWTGVSIIMLLAGICGDGLVVRRPQAEEEHPPLPGSRPAGQLGRHAVAAGDRQILLGRRRP